MIAKRESDSGVRLIRYIAMKIVSPFGTDLINNNHLILEKKKGIIVSLKWRGNEYFSGETYSATFKNIWGTRKRTFIAIFFVFQKWIQKLEIDKMQKFLQEYLD